MPIDLNNVIERNDHLKTARIDQEIVIMNVATNKYIALDEIGRCIWEILATPCRVDDLCQQLSKKFDATTEQITADVLAFLTDLEREGLVHGVDE